MVLSFVYSLVFHSFLSSFFTLCSFLSLCSIRPFTPHSSFSYNSHWALCMFVLASCQTCRWLLTSWLVHPHRQKHTPVQFTQSLNLFSTCFYSNIFCFVVLLLGYWVRSLYLSVLLCTLRFWPFLDSVQWRETGTWGERYRGRLAGKSHRSDACSQPVVLQIKCFFQECTIKLSALKYQKKYLLVLLMQQNQINGQWDCCVSCLIMKISVVGVLVNRASDRSSVSS